MTKIVDQVKSGLKGVRGVGDIMRGEFLGATDRLFEKKNDPKDAAARTKNNAIIEKGAQDMRGAGGVFARHRWAQKGMAHPDDVQDGPAATTTPAAPRAEARNEGDLSSHRPVEHEMGRTAGGLEREPVAAEGPVGGGTMRPTEGVGGYGPGKDSGVGGFERPGQGVGGYEKDSGAGGFEGPAQGAGGYGAGKDSGIGGFEGPGQGVGGYEAGDSGVRGFDREPLAPEDSGVRGFQREPVAPEGYVPYPTGKPAEAFGREPGSNVPGEYRYR